MSSHSKGIVRWIINNFISSFSKQKKPGNLIAKDYLGTSYYEIPADPQGGKRKPSRWFEPLEKNNFDQDLPAEWEAWLRGRRNNPPTKEEVEASLAISNLKKINAKKLEEERLGSKKEDPTPISEGVKKEAFPIHNEYEIIPGKDTKKPEI